MSVRRTLVVAALLTAGAAVSGAGARGDRPPPWVGDSTLPPDARIGALELAHAIRDGRPGLRVVDLRDPASFEEGHVPLAERLDPERARELRPEAGTTVVLYSAGDARAARVRAVLGAVGHRDVRVLENGYGAWLREVMYPVLPDGAGAEERRAFEEAARLSRYYGGNPSFGARSGDSGATAALRERIADARAAGCGW